MRFYEFRIIKEEAGNVVVIGDSIAVGIGGSAPYAQGGISTAEVLNRVNAFVKTGNAKGTTVILSSGASNSAPMSLEDGTKLPGNLGPIDQQVKTLINAGASVALVGTGSEKSIWFPATKYTKGQKYQVDLTGVNQQLASIASSNGATFLGPLEDYDGGMHSGKGDGIHPYGGYKKLYQAGSKVKPSSAAPAAPGKPGQGASPTTDKKTAFTVDVPGPGRKGADIADLQKALTALGYPLPKYGVDGIIGTETRGAVTSFQKDNGLTVDGDPGPETIAALNNVLKDKPEIASKLVKSTAADVKGGAAEVPDFKDLSGNAKNAVGATGSAKEAVQFFIGKGWTAEQAAGIVGNLQAESGASLRIDALGDGGKAYGIAQWHPDRQRNFAKVAGKDIRESSFQEQLAFVHWELNNTESKAGGIIKKAKTAEEAAWLFDEYYERSSGAHRQKRIDNAVALLSTTSTATA